MTRILTRTLLVLTLASLSAIACQVPVFRYALERWEADDYRIVIFEKGARASETSTLIDRLQNVSRHAGSSEGHANLIVEFADIENLTDAQQWSLLDWDSIDSFPAMQVYYPESTGIETPLWQGDFNATTLEQLIASPTRIELINRITAGDSAVWLLLESGDSAADQLAETALQKTLEEVSSEMEIPEGVIRPEELADAINSEENPIEMDDVLRSRIPLKIAFSVLRIDPTNPAEAIFCKMLTASDERSARPQAIPVFGRGRMMPGIDAAQFTVPAIGGAAAYLCGACSCQVKEQNPGLDLLINTDWSRHLQDGLIATERELPPLTGAGDIIIEAETEEPPPALPTGAHTGEIQPLLSTSLFVTIGLVIAGIIGGSVWLLRRR